MNNSGIYKWTSPSGKSYIGQTKNLDKRKREFLCLSSKKYAGRKINAARRYYNKPEYWTYEVLEYCPIGQLDEREIYWINKFDTITNGYNLTEGGNARHGWHAFEEAKRKMSQAAKGRVISEDTKKKMSEANKGRTLSVEHRRKLSQAAKGRILSKETRKKMSEAHKNYFINKRASINGQSCDIGIGA